MLPSFILNRLEKILFTAFSAEKSKAVEIFANHFSAFFSVLTLSDLSYFLVELAFMKADRKAVHTELRLSSLLV